MNINPGRAADTSVTVLGAAVDEVDLIDFLNVADGWAAAIVDDATAGLTLTGSDGPVGYVDGVTEAIVGLLRLQMSSGQGPGPETSRSRGQTITADIATCRERWPSFAPAVLGAGFQSVHTFPVRVDAILIGTLDVLMPSGRNGFTVRTAGMMQAVLDVAAWGLVRRQSRRRNWEPPAAVLQLRLERRMHIEQAKGAIAEARDCTIEEAFAVLREHARHSNRRLGEVADDVLTTGTLLGGRNGASPRR